MSGSEAGDDLPGLLGADSGIVCVVGAGGKKSTIYQLISRFAGRAAVTASVYTPPFRKRLAAETLIAPADRLAALVAGASQHRLVAYACPSDKKARLAGVAPGLIVDIHHHCGFDLTLIKADGARLRRVKAPGPHEPALPSRCDTVISVVSVQAVDQPLDRITAHRPERIAALTGAALGEPITPDHVARLLAHPQGGMKHAGRADRLVPVINMVDTDQHRHTARLIAEQVLQRAPGLDRVVLARMVSSDPVVEVVRRQAR